MEFIREAGAQPLTDPEMYAICASEGIPPSAFCDGVALTIAERYLAGSLTWAAADAAMSRVHEWAYRDHGPGLSNFAWTVYSAFGLTEERHAGQPIEAADDYFCLPLLQMAYRTHHRGKPEA